jgi:phosphohistidine phosphatase
MEIYILRHGNAADAHGSMRDADRPLTSEGAAKLQWVMRRARAMSVQPLVILTSPYRRARETAQVAATALRGASSVVDCRSLIPESAPEAVWEDIRTHKKELQLMLVGHEPLLSAMYAYLLGSGTVQVDVKKGSLGRIDVDRFVGQPRGVLRWLIYPKLVAEAEA